MMPEKTKNMFRAGDVVHHEPTDEEWRLTCDEVDGHVYPMGWPETRAKASDCRLVKAATDDERISTLERCAGYRTVGSRYAQEQQLEEGGKQ